MFSIFRNVVRRQPTLIPRTLAPTYSTSTGEDSLWNEDLETVLDDAANKSKHLAGHSDRRAREFVKWKTFAPGRTVRPFEYTYKSRLNYSPAMGRKVAVGPPPRVARHKDVFHQLNIDPLSQALNPAILSEYLTNMGKIYGRNVTGLTTRSQRRIGKAIRRAKMMGVIPILSKPRKSAYDPYNKQ